MNVEIYSKVNCVFCDKAKMRLKKHNPKIYMLDTDYSREDFFIKFLNAIIKPQIIINNKNVGGYAELKVYLEQNTFDEDF